MAQRAAGMIAIARDCSELSIAIGECNASSADLDLLKIALLQIFDRPEPVPILLGLIAHLNFLPSMRGLSLLAYASYLRSSECIPEVMRRCKMTQWAK